VTLALDDQHRLDLLEQSGLKGKPITTRLTQIASAAVALTFADVCELNIIVDNEQRHVAWWPDVGPHMLEAHPAETSACLIVVSRGESLVLDDVLTDPHCAGTPWAGVFASSYMGVPVRYQDAVVGSLCVTTRARKHWTAGELAAMEGMALLVEACFPLSPTG
jgi:GAF domain-containing protein